MVHGRKHDGSMLSIFCPGNQRAQTWLSIGFYGNYKNFYKLWRATEKYSFPTLKLDVFIIPINEEMMNKSLEIAQDLRKHGVNVDFDLLSRGIGKSLKYASSINAKKVIIVGPKELEQDSITLRDMETGKQETVKIKNITQQFK